MGPPICRIDGKTPRSITLYTPVFLAVLFGLITEPGCACTWPEWLGLKAFSTAFTFLFSWPFVLAFYYGFCFFRHLVSQLQPGSPRHKAPTFTRQHQHQ